MKVMISDRLCAVQRPFAPAPCSTLRGASHTSCRVNFRTVSNIRTGGIIACHSPPLLLPAPGAASFSTPAEVPALGHVRHVAARLTRTLASKAGLSLAAQEAAAAGFNNQLDALRSAAGTGTKDCACCDTTLELYCFPPAKPSPDGRFHYCWPCNTALKRQNRAPSGRIDAVFTAGEKLCSGCGVLRRSQWFYVSRQGMLSGKCQPCTALYNTRRSEQIQRALELQEPATQKECSACENTLPVDRFFKGPRNKDGLYSYCKECASKSVVAWSANRHELSRKQALVVAIPIQQVCSQCRVCKPSTEFHKTILTLTGIRPMCKRCRNSNAAKMHSARKAETCA